MITIKDIIKRPPEFSHGKLDRARDKRLIKDTLLPKLTTSGIHLNMVDLNSKMLTMTKVTIKRPPVSNHGKLDRARGKRRAKAMSKLMQTTNGTLPNLEAQSLRMSIMIEAIIKKLLESNHGKQDKVRETRRDKDTSRLMQMLLGTNLSMVDLT